MEVSRVTCYRCNHCTKIYSTIEQARKCCEIKYCECGKALPKYRVKCEDCSEKVMFEKAKKLSWAEYTGKYIYDPNTERYFEYVGDMEEYYEEEELKLPNYVYACTEHPFLIDIENIVENECNDNHYEDAFNDIESMDELTGFIKTWCEKQKIVSYEQDYNKVILLD